MKVNKYFSIIFMLMTAVQLISITYIVDGSGSMKGFASTGAISKQINEINRIAGSDAKFGGIIMFRSITTNSVDTQAVTHEIINKPGSYYGMYTLLGSMADKILINADPGLYVIITDNVDDDGATRGNSQRFYEGLKGSDNIQSVDVVPRLLDFYGNPHRGSKKSYDGKAGLLIYLITIGKEKQMVKESMSLVRKLEQNDYTVFHIRPITSDHVQLYSPRGSRGKFSISSKKGRYYLKLRNDRKGKPVPSLLVDKENTIDFSILMESHYPYIGIAQGTKVRIEDFSVSSPGFGLKLPKPTAKVTPSKLPKPLEEGGKQRFDVKIALKPSMPSFWERLSSMFSPQRGRVAFKMVLGTSKNSLYMVDSAKSKFFTSDVSVYDKIYSSEDVISYFNPQDDKIVFTIQNENNIKDPSTQVMIMYDNGLLFLLIVVILIVFVIFFVMLYRFFKVPNVLYLTVDVELTNEKKEYLLRRFSSINLEAGTVKRKLAEVVLHLKDGNKFYFKDSIFKSIDLPPKVVREVAERNSSNVYRISVDTIRRNDV